MIIEAQVIRIPEGEMPDMASPIKDLNDPRIKRVMMRGKPVMFEGDAIGMIIMPRIDVENKCVVLTANIRDGQDIDDKYLVPTFRMEPESVIIAPGQPEVMRIQSITLADKHPDSSIEAIKCVN